MIRIIDWSAVGAAVFGFLFSLFFGLIELGNKNSMSFILLPAALISFVVLVQKLIGVVFDLQAGTVRFYSLWIRRRVFLSEIRDANCEFGILISPAQLWVLAGGGSKGRGRSAASQRTYMVNLSGSFGSRQVRFHHKRWRGQVSQCSA